jgi:hypothetical protein
LQSSQKNKHLYLFPVIVLSSALLLRAINFIVVLNLIARYPDDYNSAKSIFLNFWALFWPSLYLAEIIIYIKIRKRITERNAVLIHSWTSLFAFIVYPLLIFAFGISYRLYQDHAIARIFYSSSWIRKIIYWGLVALGHLFFILTIIKSFKKPEPVYETPGLLDEFVS